MGALFCISHLLYFFCFAALDIINNKCICIKVIKKIIIRLFKMCLMVNKNTSSQKKNNPGSSLVITMQVNNLGVCTSKRYFGSVHKTWLGRGNGKNTTYTTGTVNKFAYNRPVSKFQESNQSGKICQISRCQESRSLQCNVCAAHLSTLQEQQTWKQALELGDVWFYFKMSDCELTRCAVIVCQGF